MRLRLTYYLEVVSSWCYWAEPAWAELKQRHAHQVAFAWKIALMPPEAYPASRSQCEWFYRRSGTLRRSPFMLNSGWFEPSLGQNPVPNLVAEAGKDFGIEDDRLRLALTHAAVRDGRKVGRWQEAIAVAAHACGLDGDALAKRAGSNEITERVRASTEEFHSLRVTQRPTFLLESEIGDRAVFSGIVVAAPIHAAVEAMLSDAEAYASFAAHFGGPPTS